MTQSTAAIDSVSGALDEALKLVGLTEVSNMAPFLPFLLSLKGKPFTLKNHFPMEPAYKCRDVPLSLILRCGRQISKSTTLAALGVITSAITPHLSTIFVQPLQEQITRFSTDYVKTFIEDSPIKPYLVGDDAPGDVQKSVLRRSFANGSRMYFTFASLDPERARGISGDRLNIDEVQDMDSSFLPVLQSCLDASEQPLNQFSGTSKTSDNTIEMLWQNSSMAHWATPCRGCRHYNIASIEHDLIKMIQRKGVSCSKCGKLIDPRDGCYVHSRPEKKFLFTGLHIPQVIMPMHYDKPQKWAMLLAKMENWPRFRFLNEVLGEPCDTGSRLVSLQDLMEVCTLNWDLDEEQGLSKRSLYDRVIVGVDWGSNASGAVRRKHNRIVVEGGTSSFTVVTVVGFRGEDPTPHLLYAERLSNNMKPEDEVLRVRAIYKRFRGSLLAHDYAGAGSLREVLLVQSGFPPDKIMPFSYTRAARQPIVRYIPPNEGGRQYYSIDKTRSLALICMVIKFKMIAMPKWPRLVNPDAACLYEDFLALIESIIDRPGQSDQYLIVRNPQKPDDFCHALNFACAARWHTNSNYPELANRFGIVYQAGPNDDLVD